MRIKNNSGDKYRKGYSAIKICVAILGAMFICGCSDKAVNDASKIVDTGTEIGGTDISGTEASETQKTDSEDSRTEAVELLSSFVSDEMFASADKWPSCDDRALAAVMKKAEAGEKVTIACIGGSITQGTISNGTADSELGFKKCYADIFFEWWKTAFPDTEFEFINAGIGGTDSYLGVHRLENDVLCYEPDLVLVEFSVNDGDNVFYKQTYDNLVRKILLSESSPAVMLLFMGQTNGISAVGSHLPVGFTYKLPMLSYTGMINDMMEQNLYSAKELSGDEVHPSALGHAICGEALGKYLNNIYVQLDTYQAPDEFAIASLTNDMYKKADLLDSLDIEPENLGSFEPKRICTQYPNGWMCSVGEGEIEFSAEFRNLGILYFATVDGKSGQFDVYVDGEYAATVNADFKGGWGNAISAVQVYSSGETKVHTITIKKSPESTGDVFDLLGLLVS